MYDKSLAKIIFVSVNIFYQFKNGLPNLGTLQEMRFHCVICCGIFYVLQSLARLL